MYILSLVKIYFRNCSSIIFWQSRQSSVSVNENIILPVQSDTSKKIYIYIIFFPYLRQKFPPEIRRANETIFLCKFIGGSFQRPQSENMDTIKKIFCLLMTFSSITSLATIRKYTVWLILFIHNCIVLLGVPVIKSQVVQLL